MRRISLQIESWRPRAIVLSQFLAEPAFWGAVLFGIFVFTAFVFGLHQDIRTAVMRYLVPTMRSFDQSRWTFGINSQLLTRLLMLTAR
jgi:hypothetical protein